MTHAPRRHPEAVDLETQGEEHKGAQEESRPTQDRPPSVTDVRNVKAALHEVKHIVTGGGGKSRL